MDTWDLMNEWHLVLPPSRPSASQLSSIHSFISDVDRKLPVAVLGSTPEFRDLLNEAGFTEIHVLERNTAFYRAMSKWRVYDNPEQLIEGDWLETLKDLGNTYGLILSDLTIGNIPYSDRRNFYELVANALQPGGYFIDKVLTHPGSMLVVDDLVEKYSSLPLNLLWINYFSCEMLFCSDLLDIKQIVDSSMFYDILRQRVSCERVLAFIQYAPMITPRGCKWYYGRRWQELESDYCATLKRIAVHDDESSSPYYRRAKLFFHERWK